MAYVYRHIREDKNETFYIGIGKNSINNYKRAFSKTVSRNNLWKNIISKTEYRVEILFDNLSWNDACNKEIELIAFYGRKDLGEGTLCNMTNGGDGAYGYKVTKKQLLNRINSRFQKAKNNCSITCLDFNYNFPTSAKAEEWLRSLGFKCKESVCASINTNKTLKGLTFIRNNKDKFIKETMTQEMLPKEDLISIINEKIKLVNKKRSHSKKQKGHITSIQVKERFKNNPETFVNSLKAIEKSNEESKRDMICIETGKIFKGLKEIADYLNIKNAKGVWNVCNGKSKTAYGYKWSYYYEAL